MSLSQGLKSLLPRERRVIAAYYFEGKTLEQIGRNESVTRERIRQIRDKALRRLEERVGEFKTPRASNFLNLCDEIKATIG